jgi:ribosomal protein S12 methylthiotransferase
MKSIQNKNIKSFSVLTLGCSKNTVDSEFLINADEKQGWAFSEDPNNVNTLIINTCGFIGPAKQESINLIYESLDLKQHGKIENLIVTGCLSQRYAEELNAQISGVDLICGINTTQEIIRFMTGCKDEIHSVERHLLTPKHYAYLKIADGCQHSCGFCAIPFIKGRYLSRPKEELLSESRNLVGNGTKELIIIAQDTTYYGMDIYGKRALAELMTLLSGIDGLSRLRLMYTYPGDFPEDVIDVIRDRANICNYIDIPLQHISDKILKSMRRGTTRKYTLSLIDKIRKEIPNVAIRSTFITGYPTETDKEFKELYNFLKDAELERVGVFTYSHEENTPAYEMTDMVAEEVKEERRNILMELQHNISLKKNKGLVNKTLKVMLDEKTEDGYSARTEHDAPDVDNSVILRTKKELVPGTIYDVKIRKASAYDLYGDVK